MAILKQFTRAQKPLSLERLPQGCFTVHRGGSLVGSTLPSTFNEKTMGEIGRVVLDAFRRAQSASVPLTDLYIHFSGLTVTAREMRGGALIFLNPATLNLFRPTTLNAMHYKNLDEFILHLENYIECWKQFNHYVNLARERRVTRDDENQFLEVKSIIAQGLEAILASTDKAGPRKEDVNSLFQQAASLRYLSENQEAIAAVEAQWHKIYLGMQSLLGQLKVTQNKTEKGSGWSLFGKK